MPTPPSPPHPGELKELDNFEKNLFNVVTTGKFRKLNRSFQEKNEICYLGHQIINDCLYLQIKAVIFIKQLRKTIISYIERYYNEVLQEMD